MTDDIHIVASVEQDGELHLRNLPVKRGQIIELSMRITPDHEPEAPGLTAQQLLASGLIGMWQERGDLGDSVDYARQLRERAQQRER